MVRDELKQQGAHGSTRRKFLTQLGLGMVAASSTPHLLNNAHGTSEPKKKKHKVKYRILGKTGLKVSEIGFGGQAGHISEFPTAKVDIANLRSMKLLG
ncbi:MAG: hypothetical protein ACYS67_01355 [Planctomycetota bacterium]|jgi:hypothetical protein